MQQSWKERTIADLSGLYVDPTAENNLERFFERQAFLRAAAKVVPGFTACLVESTQDLLIDWLQRHDEERYEIYSWKLNQTTDGKWSSELRLDPPKRPLFLSVPRSTLNNAFNFYDMVNGGAWRYAPSIMLFKRLNRAIKMWAARFHIAEDWVIHAAQCAALVALPELDHPFIVVMGATPPVPISYFDGPFLGNATLDPTTATPGIKSRAAALLPPPPSWNRRMESEEMYFKRLHSWGSQHVAQEKRIAAEKGEKKIPGKRKRILAPELRYTLAAEYQCNRKSFLDLEHEYEGTWNWKESSDPEIAIKQEISRLFTLIGLKRRHSNRVRCDTSTVIVRAQKLNLTLQRGPRAAPAKNIGELWQFCLRTLQNG